MRCTWLVVLLPPLASLLSSPAHAADECTPTRLMFVLDKSSSMNGDIGGVTKWQSAVAALDEVAALYGDSMQIGLNVFPREADQCVPGETLVVPGFGTKDAIAAELLQAPPEAGSWTPMAETLEDLATDEAMVDGGLPYAVLITDGWQWCSPYDPSTRFDPVDAMESLTAAGVTTYVVGFGDSVDPESLNQMAALGGTARSDCDPTGATNRPCYFQADNPADLVSALMVIAAEVPGGEDCDGVDNDCDGKVDEDLVRACSDSCGFQGMSECVNAAWEACDIPGDEDPNSCSLDQPGGGCGCRTGASGTGALGALMIGLMFALGRRRRRC